MKLPLHRSLRLAGILIGVGLIIETSTLLYNSPIGIMIFLGIGGGLMAVGIVIYLFALVSTQPESAVSAQPETAAASNAAVR